MPKRGQGVPSSPEQSDYYRESSKETTPDTGIPEGARKREYWEPEEKVDPVQQRRRDGVIKGMGNSITINIVGGLTGKTEKPIESAPVTALPASEAPCPPKHRWNPLRAIGRSFASAARGIFGKENQDALRREIFPGRVEGPKITTIPNPEPLRIRPSPPEKDTYRPFVFPNRPDETPRASTSHTAEGAESTSKKE